MNARFPASEQALADSRENIPRLLRLDELQPPLDLRSGSYRSRDDIPQKFPQHKASSVLAGLSMFRNYMKVVERDRAAARRGEYSDFLWGYSGLELTRLFEMYGARFCIEGLEQLQPWLSRPEREKGKVVFAVNHMSSLETMTLGGYITPYMPTTFVVKSALAGGYFAPLICSRPYVALERKNPLKDLETVLREGCEILQGGRSVIVFPQGTREEGQFSRSRFNSIAARLAAKADAALVPVALRTDFWSRSRQKWTQYIPLLHPEREVHFAFGPPLAVTGRGKEAQNRAVEFISDKMRQWGVPVLD
ncbi:lysophospholipid acyltransferase family protein [Candidatus Haliotispira prima]|uniref:Lysophospholipid acyltransferase family protein n=1 Tax=Candidatus Haliotispira prima TaxID=3034016 RepID=A0ABY8MJ64_9SPIO|nr:lysophospholipid acyltransferase family protein [Candidatus Haliotispira prima]